MNFVDDDEKIKMLWYRPSAETRSQFFWLPLELFAERGDYVSAFLDLRDAVSSHTFILFKIQAQLIDYHLFGGQHQRMILE